MPLGAWFKILGSFAFLVDNQILCFGNFCPLPGPRERKGAYPRPSCTLDSYIFPLLICVAVGFLALKRFFIFFLTYSKREVCSMYDIPGALPMQII